MTSVSSNQSKGKIGCAFHTLPDMASAYRHELGHSLKTKKFEFIFYYYCLYVLLLLVVSYGLIHENADPCVLNCVDGMHK
jgi:hypothetical protein